MTAAAARDSIEEAAESGDATRVVTVRGGARTFSSDGGRFYIRLDTCQVHLLHARVLALYAEHCARYGKEAAAEELRRTVQGLETRYGFAAS